MPRNMSVKANMLIIQTMFRLTRGWLSPLDTQRNARGDPTTVNNIQPCPKRCVLMPLARIGAGTDSTTRSANRGAWPISAHAHWHSTRLHAVCAEGFALQCFSLTLGAHAQRGLRYCCCVCVCLSVCLWSFQLTLRWLFRS